MIVKKRFYHQFISFTLCICIIVGLSIGYPSAVLASSTGVENPKKQMSDISRHWAESQMDTWVGKGLIGGYPDQTFRPDNSIIRAEFMALVNRAYGFREKADISFVDASEADWFYDDIAKAVAEGYITGYGDGTVKPSSKISRQEAAVVISRLLNLPKHSSKSAIERFSDFGSIPDWSMEAVNSVVTAGYMTGYPNGTFGPVNHITRAETVVTLSRVAGEIYNKAGIYDETRTIDGNATINTAGVILSDTVIEGNLHLTPGIGNGAVTLRNVTVKGTTVVAGGGENSIIFEDCTLNKVIVAREDGKVRVSAQGSTTIQILVIKANVILDATLLGHEGGIVIVYVTDGEEVEFSGSFGTIKFENEGTVINIISCTVENLVIGETALGSSVHISESSLVNNMEINAQITVTGQGTVEKAVLGQGAEETTFEKEPEIKESPGSSVPSTPSGGGTSGGGGSTGGGTGGGQTLTTVNISVIPGVTAPVTGQVPVSTITETAQYSGSVIWSPAHGSFAADTIYTATITLTAKSGYTFNGVAANFFDLAEANSVSNTANSGTITAVFPATGASGGSGGDQQPPALTADTTGNFVKTNLDILFTDDIQWRAAVTGVKVDGNLLTDSSQYELSAGKLRLKTSLISAMQIAADYVVTIEATGYQTATVSQTVIAGLLGSGTTSEPFLVSNPDDLDRVRYYMGVPGLFFKQTADIDLNAIDWQPIGLYDQTMVTDGEPFMSDFNGNDYYIENMNIDHTSPTFSTGAGLFSHTKEAVLRNIRLKGMNIDVPNTGSVGALVGEAKETTITGCVVENSTKVKGLQGVGGLVGYAYQSTITNSRADVLVYGETAISIINHRIGGFIGDSHNSTITSSRAHGNVFGEKEVGGFAGRMDYGSIIGCFSTGNVTSTGDYPQDTGGFVGLNYHATADQCYAISAVSGRNYVGGFTGRNIGTITNCYARGSVAYTGTVAGGFVGRIQNNAANLLGGAPSDTGYNYSDVAISGSGTKIGAFLGEHDTSAPGGSGTIHHNHYNLGIAAVNQGNGANGLTLENMKRQASFPEWDFNTIWTIQEDVTTPYHRCETLSDNANLSALSVVGQSLVPSFATDISSYTVEVASDVDAVDIIASSSYVGASMTLNGTHLGSGTPLYVSLGSPGTDTEITLLVTAENEINTKTYTIVVSRQDQSLPQKSVYDILFDPSGLVAGVAKEVEFTLKAVEVKDEGYDLVRVNVVVTEQPNNSFMALTGNYGAGPVDVIALGYWGPEAGHLVTNNYDMSYNLMVYFTTPGQYTIAISLKDMQENMDIVTKNVTLAVAEAPVTTHTLTLTGQGITSNPAAGDVLDNTLVVITVTPPEDKQVAAFTVNGVDQKAALMTAPMHQYEFFITEDTTVVVAYEEIPAGSYRLNLLVNPSGGGWAVIHDGNLMTTTGTFAAGTTIPVGCMPAEGYAFVNWTVDEQVVSIFDDFDFIMPANYTNLRANFTSTTLSTPPTLNADSTQNYAGQTLMITFSDGQAWANAITEVIVGGETLSIHPDNIQYSLNTGDVVVDGQISLYGSRINPLLSPGSKEIRVKSTGYADSVVMQDITATYFDRAEFTTQPVGPVENGGLLATQPVIALFDKYNNPCTDGPSSTREITLQKKTGSSWTLGGTSIANAIDGVVVFTNLTAANSSGVAITDAQLMYEVIGTPNKYFYSESFTIPGATGLAAPALTADTTDNYAGNNLTITLPVGDWADWISAISAVKVDGISLSTPLQYNIGTDNLRFITDEITTMQTPGTYTITVEASGYNNAVVSQVVTAGLVNSAQFTTQPQGPSVSGGQLQQQPVVTLYDKYRNVCANGPSSSISVNLTRAVGDSWTIGGTNTVLAVNGAATFIDLTAANPSGAPINDARISYVFTGLPSFTIYSDYFTIPGLGSQTAPTLTADTTDNYAGNIIEITFADDSTWRATVNSIIIRTTTQIFGQEGVTLETGKLVIDTSKIQGLQEPGSHHVSIGAANYTATDTYQAITAGLAASISIETQPQGPEANGGNFQSAPVMSLYDVYNNKCTDGPSSDVAVNVEKIDNGDWVLGGVVRRNAYRGSVTFGTLSAYNLTGIEITDAKLSFTVDDTAITVDSNSFTIPPGSAGGAAPVFMLETEYNYIGYSGGNFTMTYPQNDDWTTQVFNVGTLYLDGTELTQGDDYYLSMSNGVYYLGLYEPQNYFTEVRDYIIRIEAAGYTDAVIVQPITNGAPNYLVIDTQPGSPQESGELLNPQPVIKVYDKDANLCTVMRVSFPGDLNSKIVADKYDNAALNLWYLGGTTTVDLVNGIAVFTDLKPNTFEPDDLTEGLQIVFRLYLSNPSITKVSETFTVPPKNYSLSLEANPAAGGTALIDNGCSSGSFIRDAQIAVTAAANEVYAFVNWTVNGVAVSDQPSFIYTMPAWDTTLVANFLSTLSQEPPPLTPDTTNNWAGYWISIDFPYNEAYRYAITAIEVEGVEYRNTQGQNDVFQANTNSIELSSFNIPPLQNRGSHEVTIKADGYRDAVVTQFMRAGDIKGDECETLAGPDNGKTYTSGQALPVIKLQLKDRYGNNLIDGRDAGIVLQAEIPLGYGSDSTLSGTLTAQADANGQIIFDNIVVDLPDGANEVNNMALSFIGVNSASNNITIYLCAVGTTDWAVFRISR